MRVREKKKWEAIWRTKERGNSSQHMNETKRGGKIVKSDRGGRKMGIRERENREGKRNDGEWKLRAGYEHK